MIALQAYLSSVLLHVNATAAQYATLFRTNVRSYPIPFFGDVERARVLTVGVNPSANEFNDGRWPPKLDVPELSQRLIGYFSGQYGPAHRWFTAWSAALDSLGVSYQDGVAHVDLSPRATKSMRSLADAESRLFTEMIEADIGKFFSLLSFCTNIRLILMAGCVGKAQYMDQFVRLHAPPHGWEMQGQSDKKGAGRVGFYHLRNTERTLPVFFCSVSPSARDSTLLAQRLVEHSTILQHAMTGLPMAWPIIEPCAECGQLEGAEYYPHFDEDPIAPHRRLLCLKCLILAIRAELVGGPGN